MQALPEIITQRDFRKKSSTTPFFRYWYDPSRYNTAR
jgi:hypothetical protein